MWGARPGDAGLDFGGDRVTPGREGWLRAVEVRTGAPAAFRRLCQLRVAPYSYDWIDNGGRRSPRGLTPGVDDLATGQRWMTIFDLVAFEPGEQLTFRMATPGARWIFGDILITYAIRDLGPDRCRLVAKLHLPPPRGQLERATRPLLAAGDLVMMRRQLLNLAALAEGDSVVT
ncbi:hypothetical protein GCM10010170_091020 [Dactylosporangium salmoneum]|uniref:Polyketide cyclase n=1 Tax=Dactylosporangium salmoneum TaxID=53361 RepID=A0ABN3HKK0_9ACTN